MKVYLIINNDRLVGISTYKGDVEYECDKYADIEKYLDNKHTYRNGRIIEVGYSQDYLNSQKEYKLKDLREKREELLKKFDIFKTNVAFGLETLTSDRKQIIMAWYYDLLNITDTLDETPLTAYPRELAKY